MDCALPYEAPEPAWSAAAIEALDEDEVAALLLRRMRKLLRRGAEVTEALVIASRLRLPIP
jgi:hypothetical protein